MKGSTKLEWTTSSAVLTKSTTTETTNAINRQSGNVHGMFSTYIVPYTNLLVPNSSLSGRQTGKFSKNSKQIEEGLLPVWQRLPVLLEKVST